jgi:hypothetical protein
MALSLRLMALTLVSTAVAAGSAFAADAPGACPAPGSPDAQVAVITRPKWVYSPDGNDMRALYPHYELAKLRNDNVMMDCTVAENGKLENCRILQDEHPGRGFDQASLKLSKVYMMTPLAQNPEWNALPECVRKAGAPHIVMPIHWMSHMEMPSKPPAGAPGAPGPAGPGANKGGDKPPAN